MVKKVIKEDGNTEHPPSTNKRKQIRKWFFTFNNYLDFG